MLIRRLAHVDKMAAKRYSEVTATQNAGETVTGRVGVRNWLLLDS